jgi:hypothetical protein
MQKDEQRRPDGRTIIYYTFDDEEASHSASDAPPQPHPQNSQYSATESDPTLDPAP